MALDLPHGGHLLHGYQVINIRQLYEDLSAEQLKFRIQDALSWLAVCLLYMPKRPAFKGSAPINLSNHLNQVLRWSLGSVEIFMSKHSPIWYGYGGGLKWLARLSYINSVVYPWTSIPLTVYCTLPALCLFTGKFIIPELKKKLNSATSPIKSVLGKSKPRQDASDKLEQLMENMVKVRELFRDRKTT